MNCWLVNVPMNLLENAMGLVCLFQSMGDEFGVMKGAYQGGVKFRGDDGIVM